MAAVLFQQRTAELEDWLDERRRKGFDIRDEVWDGVYVVMAPAPNVRHGQVSALLLALLLPAVRRAGLRLADITNVGSPGNHRIPDVTVFDTADADPTGHWLSRARIAIEIRSPGEAHDEKLAFYFEVGCDEVILVDPAARTIRWLGRDADGYIPIERSTVVDLGPGDVDLDWP